jgi:putative intracellular protease/amidase
MDSKAFFRNLHSEIIIAISPILFYNPIAIMEMIKKSVYVFLFDGYADWEISFLMPELSSSKNINLKTFSPDGKPVISMGGLKVQPDLSVNEIDPDDVFLLILTGGTAWEEKRLVGVVDNLMQQLVEKHKNLAAICAATTYLGQKGLLDHIRHTSNELPYLKHWAPEYAGEPRYSDEGAVTDGRFITASGISPIEFSREVFRKLDLHSEEDINKWYQLYKFGTWIE